MFFKKKKRKYTKSPKVKLPKRPIEELDDELVRLALIGVNEGKGVKVMARELRKQFDISVKESDTLMSTTMAEFQTEKNKQSMLRNGSEEYKFIANSDCCPICQELNDKHFKVKDMVIGENAPPMHPDCRCTVTDYVDRDEYEEWLEFVSSGGTTEEWKKSKNNGNLNKKSTHRLK